MKGQTLLVNIYGAPSELLSSEEIIRLFLVRAVEFIDMTPILHTLQVAHFPTPIKGILRGGYGLSAGMVLVESHIYIHTWPEENYARLEISSCKSFDEKKALEVIKVFFGKDVRVDYKNLSWNESDFKEVT